MLWSIESDSKVTRIPHSADYERWRQRLTLEEYEAIFDYLDARISGQEIHTSSWIPGSDWTGTVFEPIYFAACQQDETAAARFFGLILWHVMMERPEAWAFGRYEKDGIPIEGMTYFQIQLKKQK